MRLGSIEDFCRQDRVSEACACVPTSKWTSLTLLLWVGSNQRACSNRRGIVRKWRNAGKVDQDRKKLWRELASKDARRFVADV